MNNNLKQFIRDFNFQEPRWDRMSEDLFAVDRRGLTKEESHLFDAIEMAWFVSRPNSFYVKRIFGVGVGTASVIVVLVGIVMVSYYINVEYKLGLTFLTEFFA